MSVLGIVVVPNGKHPKVHAAVLSGTLSAPTLNDSFQLTPTAVEPSEQAVELAELLSAKLTSVMSVAAIRIAGNPPVARRYKAQFSRAHCEGALLFVLRRHTQREVGTIVPAGLAKSRGMKSDAFEALLAQLTSGKVNAEAVRAGLAMLPN
ncbi:hypothetical protein [Curtobacterium flaccumfaciens]|uniref:hypothetical protein n=1 Tax=Curtobacterium flaccumfaciens TaxID=2035 RepID=UPI00159A12EF|nr:hypothetical protein [Curtobacterium flaccumfaciens]QKS87391.1 hypothetical protein FK523_07530 [Curtobacterium flaccumfaciens pv. flaccumfaciens]